MSVDLAARVREDGLRDAGAGLAETINDLPKKVRERFTQELMAALAEVQASGDEARLKRALMSLDVSTRLHARADYQAALVAAKAESMSGDFVDVAAFLAELHETRRRASA